MDVGALGAAVDQAPVDPQDQSPETVRSRGAPPRLSPSEGRQTPAEIDGIMDIIDLSGGGGDLSMSFASWREMSLSLSLTRGDAEASDPIATAGAREAVAAGQAGAVVSIRMLQSSFFSARARTVARRLPPRRQHAFNQTTGLMADSFSRGFEVLFSTLEKFLALAETLADKDGSMAQFLKTVRKLVKTLPKMLDAFLDATGALDGDNDPLPAQDFLGQLGRNVQAAQIQTAEAFAAEVEISLPDGTNITISLASASATSAQVTGGPANQADPVVLDMAGDGIQLTATQQGKKFDLLGTGQAVQTAWVEGDDALLVRDANGNGQVDDAGELFTDRTGAANGFEDLSRYDADASGTIDAADPIYSQLSIYQEGPAGGRMTSLRDAGIASISLDYRDVNADDGKGNTIAQVSSFERLDGSRGTVADALFAYQQRR